MDRVSTSQVSQDRLNLRNLALMNVDTWSFPAHVMENVAPMPGFRMVLSVTIKPVHQAFALH